ncbi:hypothetical protein QTP88_002350 [Uroleucon formosanum]
MLRSIFQPRQFPRLNRLSVNAYQGVAFKIKQFEFVGRFNSYGSTAMCGPALNDIILWEIQRHPETRHFISRYSSIKPIFTLTAGGVYVLLWRLLNINYAAFALTDASVLRDIIVKTSRTQPSGSSNRKKTKNKKIEIANVMAKMPCINSYFKANNGNNVLNSTEKTSNILEDIANSLITASSQTDDLTPSNSNSSCHRKDINLHILNDDNFVDDPLVIEQANLNTDNT